MKYKLSENAVLNKIGNDYFLSDISKPNSKYMLNFSLFSVLMEISKEYLSIEEIFAKLEKKFTNLAKNNFLEKTEPILKELATRGLLETRRIKR